jgi:uncharacterized FAD-dependent dehydrogenase
VRTVDLRLPVDPTPEAPRDGDALLLCAAAAALRLPVAALGTVVVRRRSADLRKRRDPAWVLRCDVFLAGELPADAALPPLLGRHRLARDVPGLRPIVVGMGPAGLFAALAFADAGVRCVLLERGQPVERRNLDVRDQRTSGRLGPESNLCFGEGGAGTYSDGKLFTRSKHPLVRPVYERLVAMGASREILVDHHPHIGTNRLIPMMKLLRTVLQEAGHELRFGARVTDLVLDPSGRVHGVRLQDGTELVGGPVVLAAGHSARDVYRMLARRGVLLQRKDFAVGARIEHPQGLVDAAQLGDLKDHPTLAPAEYFLTCSVPEPGRSARGVYSFCMCPGGFVLPTPVTPGRLNVNGMSNSNRGSGFANAALVAQIGASEFWFAHPGDLDADPDHGTHVAHGALLGLALQERLETACATAGGGELKAPAQRLDAFQHGRDAVDLPPRATYRPQLRPARIDPLLPPRVVRALRHAIADADRRQLRGFLSREAVIQGVETTTSSPVRIPRGLDRQSLSHPGLYPCAEGAGYAGGIVSSAIDGVETAHAILRAAGLAVTPWA